MPAPPDFLPDDGSILLYEEPRRPAGLGTRTVPFSTDTFHAANDSDGQVVWELNGSPLVGFLCATYHTDGTSELPAPPSDLSGADVLNWPIGHGSTLEAPGALAWLPNYGLLSSVAAALDLQGFLLASRYRYESSTGSGAWDREAAHGTRWRWQWIDGGIGGGTWRHVHLRWRLRYFDFDAAGGLTSTEGTLAEYLWNGGSGGGGDVGTVETLTVPPELPGEAGEQRFVFLEVLWPPKPPRRVSGDTEHPIVAPYDAPGFIPGGRTQRADHALHRDGTGWRYGRAV